MGCCLNTHAEAGGSSISWIAASRPEHHPGPIVVDASCPRQLAMLNSSTRPSSRCSSNVRRYCVDTDGAVEEAFQGLETHRTGHHIRTAVCCCPCRRCCVCVCVARVQAAAALPRGQQQLAQKLPPQGWKQGTGDGHRCEGEWGTDTAELTHVNLQQAGFDVVCGLTAVNVGCWCSAPCIPACPCVPTATGATQL